MSLDTSTLSGRIAGAPISWGVCEVPGGARCFDRNGCCPRCAPSV